MAGTNQWCVPAEPLSAASAASSVEDDAWAIAVSERCRGHTDECCKVSRSNGQCTEVKRVLLPGAKRFGRSAFSGLRRGATRPCHTGLAREVGCAYSGFDDFGSFRHEARFPRAMRGLQLGKPRQPERDGCHCSRLPLYLQLPTTVLSYADLKSRSLIPSTFCNERLKPTNACRGSHPCFQSLLP